MNNVDQTFEEDNKENSVKNLNASNEAKRLEEKVKTYNNNVRSLNSALGGKISKRSIGPSIPSIKNIFTQNNNKKASKIAGTKMNSTGSSKMLNDGVLNNDLTQTSTSKLKKKGFLLNALDKFSGNDKEREVADEVSSSGEQGVRLGLKVIKWLLFSSGPIATIFIFIGLFTVASQVYINVIGLGTADALADDSKNVESKINKKDSEDFNNEITDDNVAFDIFIEDSNSLKFSICLS